MSFRSLASLARFTVMFDGICLLLIMTGDCHAPDDGSLALLVGADYLLLLIYRSLASMARFSSMAVLMSRERWAS
jgi:hypothetical protein